jgi:hypothetical protein
MFKSINIINDNARRPSRPLRYYVALPTVLVENYITAHQRYNALRDEVDMLESLSHEKNGEDKVEEKNDADMSAYPTRENMQGLKEHLGTVIQSVLQQYEEKNVLVLEPVQGKISDLGPAFSLEIDEDAYVQSDRKAKGQVLASSFQEAKKNGSQILDTFSAAIGFSSKGEQERLERSFQGTGDGGIKTKAGFANQNALIGLLTQFDYNPHIIATALNIGMIGDLKPGKGIEKYTAESVQQDVRWYMQQGVIPVSKENFEKMTVAKPVQFVETVLLNSEFAELLPIEGEVRREETFLISQEKYVLVETDVLLEDVNGQIAKARYFVEYPPSSAAEPERLEEEKKGVENELRNSIDHGAFKTIKTATEELNQMHDRLAEEKREPLEKMRARQKESYKQLAEKHGWNIDGGNEPQEESAESKEIRLAFQEMYGPKGEEFFSTLKDISEKDQGYKGIITLAYQINFLDVVAKETKAGYQKNAETFGRVLKNKNTNTLEKVQKVLEDNAANQNFMLCDKEGKKIKLTKENPQRRQAVMGSFIRAALDIDNQDKTPAGLIAWISESDLQNVVERFFHPH